LYLKERKPPGRPRSERVHAAILAATAELLGASGYAALTMDGVAERAGVARQTIYRRWSSKLRLVIELLEQLSESAPLPDTGSVRSDIAALYRRYATNIPSAGGPIIPALIAESLYNDELAGIVRAYIMTRRRQAMLVFERAVDRGEIDPAYDREMLVDMISGFSWYRKLIAGIPIADADAETMAALLLDGIARPRPTPGRLRH
jgi:AcrR family transcriptional regulator